MTDDEIRAEDDKLITVDVARAVEENEFVPYVQPLYDMASGKIVAGEALVRWTLPEDGSVIPAALFVPSLEHTNTICGLDWFMIDRLTEFIGSVVSTEAAVPIALNISYQHGQDPEFSKRLAATADWHKATHDHISVELSEATLLKGDKDVEQLVRTALDDGFVVAADNLQTGAEGLRAIAELGIRHAKVSASIWRDRPQMLSELVSVAKELGIRLCAERVEQSEEAHMLVAAGIGVGMGFLFAQPMDLQAFKALCDR